MKYNKDTWEVKDVITWQSDFVGKPQTNTFLITEITDEGLVGSWCHWFEGDVFPSSSSSSDKTFEHLEGFEVTKTNIDDILSRAKEWHEITLSQMD